MIRTTKYLWNGTWLAEINSIKHRWCTALVCTYNSWEAVQNRLVRVEWTLVSPKISLPFLHLNKTMLSSLHRFPLSIHPVEVASGLSAVWRLAVPMQVPCDLISRLACVFHSAIWNSPWTSNLFSAAFFLPLNRASDTYCCNRRRNEASLFSTCTSSLAIPVRESSYFRWTRCASLATCLNQQLSLSNAKGKGRRRKRVLYISPSYFTRILITIGGYECKRLLNAFLSQSTNDGNSDSWRRSVVVNTCRLQFKNFVWREDMSTTSETRSWTGTWRR